MQRSSVFWLVAIFLFGAMVGVGYAVRPSLEDRGLVERLASPPDGAGWCCAAAGQSCKPSASVDACMTDGLIFDAHKDVCDSACASFQ